ncbi:MAG: DNA primase [Sphingomonadales bacterium]
MAFPPGFLDEIRARVPVSDVVGRSVKLTKKGREYLGLCPFHNEKTPSFTVNDDKGFYHCFGCGAHGDVFRFITEQHGLSFLEAVEQTAREAGLAMTEQKSVDAARAEQSRRLTDLMQAAADWFTSRLADEGGRAARAYIEKRQMTPQTRQAFALGYAPESRQRLRQAMTAKGWRDGDLVDVGLAILPEDGGEPYDRFRGRLMFPIRDRQGRCIAFGGRALSKDAKAKYLNSPETTLFHKGRTLYNIDQARKPAYDTGQIIVCEGYMDVITLAQAGFPGSVAPLGTALTEEQLRILWRMVDEPILCFDGDKAGLRAARRALERSLPLLSAGKSLRFALLPEGKDPDDLLRDEGKAAFEAVLESSLPLADMLWNSALDQADLSTPERKAALERDVMVQVSQIGDQSVKTLYQSDMRSRLKTLFYGRKEAAPRGKRQSYGRWEPPKRASQYLKSSNLARSDSAQSVGERIVLATLLNHPSLLISHLETLVNLIPSRNDIQTAFESVLSAAPALEGVDSQAQKNTLRASLPSGLAAALDRDIFIRSLSFTRADAETWRAEAGLDHTLALLRRVTVLEEECEAAERALMEMDEPASTQAFAKLSALREEIAQQNRELSQFDRGLLDQPGKEARPE